MLLTENRSCTHLFRQPFLLMALVAALLSACAPQAHRIATISTPHEKPDWAFQASDVPVDPGYRFGKLDNGMRYVVRQNATPRGTIAVRMEVAAGSLDESDAERGFAHFVEHMAFNGSTNVPEGEMVRLLEREGLAFGADTNASTDFQRTTYQLDLPKNDPALLDTALMLMRETASELKFAPGAVDRERGVVLAEMRDRNSWQMRNLEDQLAFAFPDALYPKRLPIGVKETLEGATADALKAFWAREYVPAQTTVIVIGDLPADQAEKAIRERFASWQARPAEPQPSPGPIDAAAKGRTDVYIDPAMAERMTAARLGDWIDKNDTTAQRREHLLRRIGYAVINRRLQRISRQEDPPFRGAGFATPNLFKTGRMTNLVVDTIDGKWRRGLIAAAREYVRALRYGFDKTEVAEQLAEIRNDAKNDAASAETRSNGAMTGAVLALLRDEIVPGTPQSSYERLEAFVPEITPKKVLQALRREVVPLKDPLLRLQGRKQPEGGAAAIRRAWNEAMAMPLGRESRSGNAEFAYTRFGPPGTVASDQREARLGIRELRFENGVRLNIKHTDIEKDGIRLQLSVDGGDMLNTRANPMATQMARFLPQGGLGKHSQDELQSLLAGHTLSFSFDSTPETFVSSARTTPQDLELQLQLLAALISDPGYRKEGEVEYRVRINNFFAQLRATPNSALSSSLEGILSDNDPRFTLQSVEDHRKLTFASMKSAISDRLAKGAIEIGLVGDIDEEQAITMVARTFGALPAREADFGAYPEQRQRAFTASRGKHIIRHTGPADQALLRLTWPTRDDSDPAEAIGLQLLERIVRIELTDTLREKLGKAYSPSARSTASHFWPGYGTFAINASVAVSEVSATRAAIAEVLERLRDGPVSDDQFQRAREPLIEAQTNALKSNGGWMSLVDRAQTETDQIDRYLTFADRLRALTPGAIQALAKRYLGQSDAVEVLVLPEGVDEPLS
ncbi:MAG: M16 family metallopeptidase [Novosphingobium sp.]